MANSVEHSDDESVQRVLEACLRAPVLRPEHAGHSENSTQKRKFQDLQVLMRDLYGPGGADFKTDAPIVPVCGTQPADGAFRDQVERQLRKLKNLLDMWAPTTGSAAEARFNTFEEQGGLSLLVDLLGEDKLKAMVRSGSAFRRDDLKPRLKPIANDPVGLYVEVKADTIKKFTVHYRSKHTLLTPHIVQRAYDSWLCLLHAEVEVIDERGQEQLPPKQFSSLEEDHVYIEDDEFKSPNEKAAAISDFPKKSKRKTNTRIRIAKQKPNNTDALSEFAPNILGVLRHEVGHTLGFMHESDTDDGDLKLQKVAVDKDVGSFRKVLDANAEQEMDPLSVMLYRQLDDDKKANRVTELSARDVYGCRNFFGSSPACNQAPELWSSAFPTLRKRHQEALIKGLPCPCFFDDLKNAAAPGPLLSADWQCRACGLLTHYHRRRGPSQ